MPLMPMMVPGLRKAARAADDQVEAVGISCSARLKVKGSPTVAAGNWRRPWAFYSPPKSGACR
jgi:hypothetical protein